MRDKEKKHRKGQETTIGKIIYGFLLFMPLIAIGVTCGYAMFNKNAYQSYSDSSEIQDYREISSNYNQLEANIQIDFIYSQEAQGYSPIFGFTNTSLDLEDIFPNNTITYLGVYTNGTRKYIAGKETQSSNTILKEVNIDNFTITYDGSIATSSVASNVSGYKTYIYKYIPLKLDNVFYYSIDKVTESPLFSWAQNSIIYTTTASTCTALSITTPFIPLLMSYWLIISVIYFLYDIALMLVWLIHRKIHELQESL